MRQRWSLVHTLAVTAILGLIMPLPCEHLHLVPQSVTSTFDDTKIIKIIPLPPQFDRAWIASEPIRMLTLVLTLMVMLGVNGVIEINVFFGSFVRILRNDLMYIWQCGAWDRHADPGPGKDPDPVWWEARLDVSGRQQDRRSPQGQGQDQTQEALEPGPFPSCYFLSASSTNLNNEKYHFCRAISIPSSVIYSSLWKDMAGKFGQITK